MPSAAPTCTKLTQRRGHTTARPTQQALRGTAAHGMPTCLRSPHCRALPPLSCQVYYGTPASHEIKGVWCHPCYGEIKTETVPLDGFNIRKAELEKRKNDDEVRGGLLGLS